MTCAETVRAYLLTLTPVTTLVATKDITTSRFQQSGTKPSICLFQIGDVQMTHTRGTASKKRARIQVDCLATTMAQARAVDQAVMGEYVNGVVTGLRGAKASVGSPAVEIVDAAPDGYRESYEGDDLKACRVSRDYMVVYEG